MKLCKIIAILVLCFSLSAVFPADELYRNFQNPPARARPDVYWWWNGNAVTDREILRELDVLKAAGIGGALIFPMAMTMGASPAGGKPLEWLSPEWSQRAKTAVEGAKARGMQADLLAGTGWPFGGPFLKAGERIQRVKVAQKTLAGPGVFKGDIGELMVLPGGAYGETDNGSAPRLMFLRLVPRNSDKLEPGLDLTGRVQPDGRVEFEIPPGTHTLYTGTWKEGCMIVNIPALGGQGPVLDHFNRDATERYLEEFARRVAPVMGKSFRLLRSLHCDSFEFTGANWTGDLLPEFRKRRGYGLEPYLHYALGDENPEGSALFSDAIWRVRHDLWKTLSELFEERFVQPFHRWSRSHGVQSRIQAYGGPAVEHLDIKLIPDRPMCETWISVERNIPPNETLIPLEERRSPDSLCLWGTMSNKYTSSAAHLTGRREVSCETMTNDMAAFRTTLEQTKLACDLNYITGVNHPVFHGYNYNPPEAGFPGWFYCGEYFDERNSWWPYFRRLTDYTARLSWVLQSSRPQAEIALIDPSYRLWETLHRNGYSADYISGKVLRAADFRGGKLRFGSAIYEVLVLNEAATLEPETVLVLERFARARGKILFIGQPPHCSPGYKDAARNDRVVQEGVRRLLESGLPNVLAVPAPDRKASLTWIRQPLNRLGVRPAVAIRQPDPLLYQIHQRAGRREIFFFANLNCNRPVSLSARFDTGSRIPWRWDPETGRRAVYPFGRHPGELDVRLKPMESLLLVFEPVKGGKRPGAADPLYSPLVPDPHGSREIASSWQVEFRPARGKPFRRTLPRLLDFSQDSGLAAFSGTAVYRTEFAASGLGHSLFSLGKACEISEVSLNGRRLGVRWWGEHLYNTAGALRKGRNVLEIKITNVLSNYVRTLTDNPVARIWTVDKNRPALPAGLVGPVKLFRAKKA
ncbi:MAG: hypothetical protein IT210_11185 [Armatimonadetes bacterium]|nr:hypothetical protein [Armatimonadota bacterium]